MKPRETVWRWVSSKKWAAVCIFLAAAGARANDFQLESAGVRMGLPANESSTEFRQAEAFLNWDPGWDGDLGREWHFRARLDVSAGWLGDGGVDAAIGTVGPTLVLSKKPFPVSLEGGISPTVMTRSDFSTKDFGIPFQFTCHAGLNWDFVSHLRLGYRFQHMSNAGFVSPNPGLNLHVIALSYVF